MKRVSKLLCAFIIATFVQSILGVSGLHGMQAQEKTVPGENDWEKMGLVEWGLKGVFKKTWTSGATQKYLEWKNALGTNFVDWASKEHKERLGYFKDDLVIKSDTWTFGQPNCLYRAVQVVQLFVKHKANIKDGIKSVFPELFDFCWELIKRDDKYDKKIVVAKPIKEIFKLFVDDKDIFEILLEKRQDKLLDMCLVLMQKGQTWWLDPKPYMIVYFADQKTVGMEEGFIKVTNEGLGKVKEASRKKILALYAQFAKKTHSYFPECVKAFAYFITNQGDAYSSEFLLLGIEICMAMCADCAPGGILVDSDVATANDFLAIIGGKLKTGKMPADLYDRLPEMYWQLLEHINVKEADKTVREKDLLLKIKEQVPGVISSFIKKLTAKTKKNLTPELQAQLFLLCSLLIKHDAGKVDMEQKTLELVVLLSKKIETEATAKRLLSLCRELVAAKVGIKEVCGVITAFSKINFDHVKKELLMLSADIIDSGLGADQDLLKVIEFFAKKGALDSSISQDFQKKLLNFYLKFVKTEQGQVVVIRALEAFLTAGLLHVETDIDIQKDVLDLCVELKNNCVKKDLVENVKKLAVKIIDKFSRGGWRTWVPFLPDVDVSLSKKPELLDLSLGLVKNAYSKAINQALKILKSMEPKLTGDFKNLQVNVLDMCDKLVEKQTAAKVDITVKTIVEILTRDGDTDEIRDRAKKIYDEIVKAQTLAIPVLPVEPIVLPRPNDELSGKIAQLNTALQVYKNSLIKLAEKLVEVKKAI
ncbi:MAG: hypothetical protein ABH827_06555 [bacterium]